MPVVEIFSIFGSKPKFSAKDTFSKADRKDMVDTEAYSRSPQEYLELYVRDPNHPVFLKDAPPQYGDVSEYPDLMEVQNRLARLKSAYSHLPPSEARKYGSLEAYVDASIASLQARAAKAREPVTAPVVAVPDPVPPAAAPVPSPPSGGQPAQA
ncbi:hypothetical protein [robinz microvirus RP_188]|nr:hypothetical protein [robinz microvirus RP_188]